MTLTGSQEQKCSPVRRTKLSNRAQIISSSTIYIIYI